MSRTQPDSSVRKVPFYAVPGRLKKLEQQAAEINSAKSCLPSFQDLPQLEGYGYHSGYMPILDRLPEQPRWTLDFVPVWAAGRSYLILVPAVDRRAGSSRGYGFPKRFAIRQLRKDQPPITVADWTRQDFPDPGRLPVIFPFSGKEPLQMQVFKGAEEGGLEYFSLGEIGWISNNELQQIQYISSSSSFESPPYWSVSYLYDQRMGLGIPSGSAVTGKEDFLLRDHLAANESLTVEIDLGENKKIGWINLYPARVPIDIFLPGYGFPGELGIELVAMNLSGARGKTNWIRPDTVIENPGNNMLRFAGRQISGRWVRFHFARFPVYQKQAAFSMGELEVVNGGRNLSKGRPVRLEGISPVTTGSPELLVDGYANGGPILEEALWLHRLAARKPLETHLAQLEAGQAQLQSRWSELKRTSIRAVWMLVALTMIILAVFVWISRRKAETRLRMQIANDLHDDIGSKLAAIRLASAYVQRQSGEPKIIERGRRIERVARDMTNALRDVLWFTSNETDTLDQLIRKLGDIAVCSVDPDRLSLHIPSGQKIPSRRISIDHKRDLFMLFREALHNAVSHSRATEIRVYILLNARTLKIEIHDNGTGFDIESILRDSSARAHYGLGTMQMRAKRLHADFQMESAPGKGTRICLKMKMRFRGMLPARPRGEKRETTAFSARKESI
ncbi:MAG: ATP-binding protein [Kiritimatiellales bacterium]